MTNHYLFCVADLCKSLLVQLPQVIQLARDILFSDTLIDITPDVLNGIEMWMVRWKTENCVSMGTQYVIKNLRLVSWLMQFQQRKG
jgi:hypothetical protein